MMSALLGEETSFIHSCSNWELRNYSNFMHYFSSMLMIWKIHDDCTFSTIRNLGADTTWVGDPGKGAALGGDGHFIESNHLC